MNLDFEIKQARLEPSKKGGNNIVISMVTIYKDGKYLKHAKLNEELLKAINAKGTIKFNVNLDKLDEMTEKNPHLGKLVETMDLEQIPTDQDIIDWFKAHQVPLTPIRVNEAVVIERPSDYVETHLKGIEQYGPLSFVTRNYISHLTELHSALIKQGWTG